MLCTEPALDVAVLGSLVDAVDAALWGGASPSPDSGLLLRVVPDPEPVPATTTGPAEGAGELGLLPLGGGHPLDALLGLVAPPSWSALGVATRGNGRRLDGGGDRDPDGDGDGAAAPVHVTMLLARSGEAAGVLRRAGGPPARLQGAPEGVVADACRRALGLATAPPPGGTAGLWTRWWLDRLVQAAGEQSAAGAVAGWAEAVAHHPASFVPLPGSRRPPLPLGAPAPEPVAVVAASAALASSWTWARLRSRPHLADLPGPPVGRRVAQWMDDGMFARWQLSALPPVADLLDACRALLPEGVAARVTAVVAGTVAGTEPEDGPGADR